MRSPVALPWGIMMIATAVAAWFIHSQQLQATNLDREIRQLQAARAADAKKISAVSEQASLTRQLALVAEHSPPPSDFDSEGQSAPPSETPGAEPDSMPDEVAPSAEGDEARSTAAGSAPLEMVTANIEAHFESDVADVTAADTAHSIFEQVAPFLGDGSSIEAVECRATMCRLESVQSDLETYRSFVAQVSRSEACRECFYTQTGETDDERPKLTLYLARAGHPLPRVE